ncbi:MAG: hypothetical protein A2Y51_05885 [Gallionellales bacterium RIFCSPLOWO2_02_60_31]|nr:MAG: hypothetical protein A2Y51_05885 [Gallionellales bacterium RIFCSPLOWO2_02_60_31]
MVHEMHPTPATNYGGTDGASILAECLCEAAHAAAGEGFRFAEQAQVALRHAQADVHRQAEDGAGVGFEFAVALAAHRDHAGVVRGRNDARRQCSLPSMRGCMKKGIYRQASNAKQANQHNAAR